MYRWVTGPRTAAGNSLHRRATTSRVGRPVQPATELGSVAGKSLQSVAPRWTRISPQADLLTGRKTLNSERSEMPSSSSLVSNLPAQGLGRLPYHRQSSAVHIPRNTRMRLYGPLLFWLTLFPMLSRAQERDLGSLSIEDLINVKVTSVAKKEQTLLESPAAIFVITQEDIRRSGMTSVPELLRMVPGINVAQVDGNVWAISARGFNSQFANKLLVLIDGRSVYSPLFSGVYWEVQDLLLEDIDRIEVIRGPGAAVWGANAVNGVINILTKHAAETKGGLVTAGASTAEQRFVGFRY